MVRQSASLTLTRDSEELRRLFFSLRNARDVADLLEVPYEHLNYILYWGKENYPYRSFQISKKSGGVREISAPHSSLQILQSKLNDVLTAVYQPKPPAHGFVPGRSILSNALEHVGKRFVLNVDLENFFPSINFGRVRGVFIARPYGIGPRAATVLAQICCHDNQLPQGGPTSPIISNMVCAKLDGELQGLAKKYRCTYTRYADDLTFSTTRTTFPAELAHPAQGWAGEDLVLGSELVATIASNGFSVNKAKQRLRHRQFHQEVTGVTVNKFPNVRRRFVRQIRAMIHAVDRYGAESAEAEFRERYDVRRSRRPDSEPPPFRRVLRGKLDFLKMIKGANDAVYRNLSGRLHSIQPDWIDPPPVQPAVSPGGEVPEDKTWQHWYEQYQGLVYQIVVRKDGRELGGTAFAWRRRALATAAHNLAGEVFISPPFPEGQAIPASTFVFHTRRDENVDVALVQIWDPAKSFDRQFPVRTTPLNPGEQVAALAYPRVPLREPELGIYPGLVESRMPTFGGGVDTIQVTIEIAGGMSGGPVIDRGGNLVGIIIEDSFEQTADDVAGRAFRHILPVSYLRELEYASEDT